MTEFEYTRSTITDRTHPRTVAGHGVEMTSTWTERGPDGDFTARCLDCDWTGKGPDKYDVWGDAQRHNAETADGPEPAWERLVGRGVPKLVLDDLPPETPPTYEQARRHMQAAIHVRTVNPGSPPLSLDTHAARGLVADLALKALADAGLLVPIRGTEPPLLQHDPDCECPACDAAWTPPVAGVDP